MKKYRVIKPKQEWARLPHVAELLGVHPDTVRKLVRSGVFTGTYLGRNTLLINLDSVNKYLEKNRTDKWVV